MESPARKSAPDEAPTKAPEPEAPPRRAWRPIALVVVQIAGVALSLHLLVASSGGRLSVIGAVLVMLAVASSMLFVEHK